MIRKISHNLVNKELQYTFCPISPEVKVTAGIEIWFDKRNIRRKIFFFKNQAENKAGRVVPDLFLFLIKAFLGGKWKWSAA